MNISPQVLPAPAVTPKVQPTQPLCQRCTAFAREVVNIITLPVYFPLCLLDSLYKKLSGREVYAIQKSETIDLRRTGETYLDAVDENKVSKEFTKTTESKEFCSFLKNFKKSSTPGHQLPDTFNDATADAKYYLDNSGNNLDRDKAIGTLQALMEYLQWRGVELEEKEQQLLGYCQNYTSKYCSKAQMQESASVMGSVKAIANEGKTLLEKAVPMVNFSRAYNDDEKQHSTNLYQARSFEQVLEAVEFIASGEKYTHDSRNRAFLADKIEAYIFAQSCSGQSDISQDQRDRAINAVDKLRLVTAEEGKPKSE